MRNNLMRMNIQIHRLTGAILVLGSVLVGYILARFMLISTQAAVIVLSFGAVTAVALLMRKVDYLLIGWIILTTFIWVIVKGIFPRYEELVGRGIFWGLLGFMIVAWAVDNILRGRRFTPFDNVPLKTTIVVFILWCALSLFTSVDVFVGVKQLVKYAIVFSASYMFYDLFSRDRTSINTLVKIMLFLTVAVSFMTVASALESLILGTPIYKRITLWFWNPNTLGTFIFVGIPITITAGFQFIRSGRVKLFLLVIMLLALLFSSHRTSWVAASVSILYLLSKTRVKTLVLFAIVIGLFLSGLLLPVLGEDFYNFATRQQYTGRKEIWGASWHAILEHPFLGTGPGTSVTTISEYMITPGFKGQDTHNSYLKNAVEMGVPSVLIVLAFYAFFLYYANKIERNLRSDYLRSVTRGTIATFLGLFFYDIAQNGFFMTVFGASEFTVIWPYVIAPLPFACERLDERSPPTS